MKTILQIISVAVIFLVLVTCQKEEPIPGTDQPTEKESLIKEESKTQSVVAATGGVIELESGIRLDIPANSLASEYNYCLNYRPIFLRK